jgi:hypothetical protein
MGTSETATIVPSGMGVRRPQETLMKPLLFLANAFIDTFGITRPTEQAANRAARFIAFLLGAVLLVVIVGAGVALYLVSRH